MYTSVRIMDCVVVLPFFCLIILHVSFAEREPGSSGFEVEDVNHMDMGSYSHSARRNQMKKTLVQPKDATSIVNHKPDQVIECSRSEQVCPFVENPESVYLRRIIGSLLDQMDIGSYDFGPGEAITVSLGAEISFESYSLLNKFIVSHMPGGGEDAPIHVVADILSNILRPIQNENAGGTMDYVKLKFVHALPNLFSPKLWLIMFSLIVLGFTTLILCYQMYLWSNSPLMLLFYGLLLYFVFSCLWIYAETHENAKAENSARLEQYERKPRDCDYQNFTLWEQTGYFLRVKIFQYRDECVDFYREMGSDPFYKYTPVEAISESAARLFFHPIGYVGGKLGLFFHEITAAVPFWMRPFLCILIFIGIFAALFPYKIKTPLFCIEPATRRPEIANHETETKHRIQSNILVSKSTDTQDLQGFIKEDETGVTDETKPSQNAGHGIRTSSSFLSRIYPLYSNLQSIFMSIISLLIQILRDVPQYEFQNEEASTELNPQEEEMAESDPAAPPAVVRESTCVGSILCASFFDEETTVFDDELLEGELLVSLSLSERDPLTGLTFEGILPNSS